MATRVSLTRAGSANRWKSPRRWAKTSNVATRATAASFAYQSTSCLNRAVSASPRVRSSSRRPMLHRRNAELRAHDVEGTIGVGEVIESGSEIDTARRAALDRPQHRFDVEQATVSLGNGRDAEPVVELKDAEEQEQETVRTCESGLKCSLLDFLVGLDPIAGQHMADVVEDHRADAVLFTW